jgi:hypothetical protein
LKKPENDLLEPFAWLGDGVVHALAQTFLDLLQLRPQPIAATGSAQPKPAGPRGAADQSEAKKVEGLRFAQPARASVRSIAAKLDQAGLVRMQRQRELRKPRAHCGEKPMGIGLALEADHHVIGPRVRAARGPRTGAAHDDHLASDRASSPARGPQVEDVVQVDVGEQRRDHRSLPVPLSLTVTAPSSRIPALSHLRIRPTMRLSPTRCSTQPISQSWLTVSKNDRMSAVQYPVHLPTGNPDHQSIERIRRSAAGSEPVREPEKILLVDGAQHAGDGALDDFVLHGGNRQWPLLPVRLPVYPSGATAADGTRRDGAAVQICEPELELCLVVAPRHAVHARGGVTLQRVERLPQAVTTDVVE